MTDVAGLGLRMDTLRARNRSSERIAIALTSRTATAYGVSHYWNYGDAAVVP